MINEFAQELSTPDAVGLLAALRRKDPGLPPWPDAAVSFADYDAQVMQDRIMRALVDAYRSDDKRAGPVMVALLWRRICGRCNGDADAAQTLVVGVLEVARVYERIDSTGLPMRLVSAGYDRTRSRSPAIKTVPLADLLPAASQGDDESTADLLTPKEAAARLRLKTTDTLAEWARRGLIKPIRTPTGRYRYPVSEVERIKAEGRGSEPVHRQRAGNTDATDDHGH